MNGGRYLTSWSELLCKFMDILSYNASMHKVKICLCQDKYKRDVQ